jgi:hypothetical protein
MVGRKLAASRPSGSTASVGPQKKTMATLLHELWLDTSDLPGLCINGPEGDGFRSLQEPGSRIIKVIEASSTFDALTKYYEYLNWGEYTSEFSQDHIPYSDERLRIQMEWRKSITLEEYDIVFVKVIHKNINRVTASNSSHSTRAPEIGDIGTIVHKLKIQNNQTQGYIVECIDKNGFTIWLSDFVSEELEILIKSK